MKTLLCAMLLAVVALTAAETDITGNWSGSFVITAASGETRNDTAYLKLKQTGKEVTGTVGPNEDQQFPITKGSIDGDKITIEADHDGHLLKLNLVVAAERITGGATLSSEEQATAKLDVTRLK